MFCDEKIDIAEENMLMAKGCIQRSKRKASALLELLDKIDMNKITPADMWIACSLDSELDTALRDVTRLRYNNDHQKWIDSEMKKLASK